MYELTLVPIKQSRPNNPPPTQSTTVTVGFEIYQIGGAGKRSSVVRVLDCQSHTWRDAPNMMVERKRAKSCFLDGKIYVMGGSRKKETWGEVFEVKTQTWKPMPRPKDDVFNSDHRVVAFGGKLYIFTRNEKYGYDPKEGRWLLDEGFVGLERHITGLWCVIDNVIFTEHKGKYWWYDSRRGKWLNVTGLEDLYVHDRSYRPVIQLVNYGEKLVIILVDIKYKRIWFAVIRLEKRMGVFGLEILGKTEQYKVLHMDPKSYQLLSCLSVSL